MTVDFDTASFRDNSGFVFRYDNEIYRAISPAYFKHFFLLTHSGLYQHLTDLSLLLPHSAVDSNLFAFSDKLAQYKIIKPKRVPFISYPYEWSFSQLKDAALLTLSIQKKSLSFGMTLKDASAFNIQFIGNHPIFIDTLSFETYQEGAPWIAYKQFCQHFLAPLTLMSYRSISLSKLSQIYLDGIPLNLVNALLPKRSLLNSVILSHIFIHSKFQKKEIFKKYSPSRAPSVSKHKLITLLEHLENGIRSLQVKKNQSEWTNYEKEHNYSAVAKEKKQKIISDWIKMIQPKILWDLGCNTGEFSIPASRYSEYVVAMDSDAMSIEFLYRQLQKINNVIPLVVDIANPTPSIGWDNKERKEIFKRGKANLLLALALIHHLRITNSIPMEKISRLFSELTEWLIIEFVPKNDSQVQRMLLHRTNIFNDLEWDSFKKIFETYFEFREICPLPDSQRILCLLKKW